MGRFLVDGDVDRCDKEDDGVSGGGGGCSTSTSSLFCGLLLMFLLLLSVLLHISDCVSNGKLKHATPGKEAKLSSCVACLWFHRSRHRHPRLFRRCPRLVRTQSRLVLSCIINIPSKSIIVSHMANSRSLSLTLVFESCKKTCRDTFPATIF